MGHYRLYPGSRDRHYQLYKLRCEKNFPGTAGTGAFGRYCKESHWKKELQAVPEEVGEKSRGSLQEKEVTGEETALAEDEGAEVQSVETKEESYTERLKKLDSQIQKTREQDTDSNVYSAKTSAETELKMWDGELNAVYNALLEALSQEEALKLANEEKDWLKKRESDAADSSGKTGNGLSYASSMVNQTRERAYELAKRYDELAGKD